MSSSVNNNLINKLDYSLSESKKLIMAIFIIFMLPLSGMAIDIYTPSLVTVGDPKLFCRMTLRPLGPRVTLTALANLPTPRRIASRASWSKAIIFAMSKYLLLIIVSVCQRVWLENLPFDQPIHLEVT